MGTVEKLQRWIAEQQDAGATNDQIMSALEMALDLMREEADE